MTVAVDAELRIREYAGDDSANARAVPFKFLSADDLKVTRVNADGSETLLVRGTDYTVAGAGSDAGGSVTPLAAIATGTSWRIEGDMTLGQPTDYTAGDDFPAESHERALDRAMIGIEEARRDVEDTRSRSLLVPRGEVGGVLPPQAERASKYLSYLPDGETPFMSSGTGADAGLREDLGTEAGGAMVRLRRAPTANVRSIESIIAEMGLSITDFGADGTGSNPAADTTALIAAHAALPAEGGIIFVPDGVYEINQTITFTKRVVLRGNGCSTLAGGVARSQIYKGAGVSGPLIEVTALDTIIENLGFEGKPGNVGDGIHIKAGRNVMRNVSVHRMGQDNIRIGSDEQLNCNHYLHDHIFTKEAGRYCYHVHDEYYLNNLIAGANCNHGLISHIDAGWAADDAIVIHGAWYTTLFASLVQESTGDGIHVIASGQDGARYTKIIAGEQNENNDAFNINNSGFQTEMYGVTPGLVAKLNDTGVGTIILSSGLSKVDTLRVTNILTSERPTAGSVVYPLVSESTGNAGNGRGAGVEFKVPNGSGTSRVGGRQSVQQEATNIERWSLSLNISGVMTEVMEFSGNQLAFRPITNGTIACGGATKQWSWGYFSNGIRVNNIQVVGAQGAAIANPAGGATVDTEARAAVVSILSFLRGWGAIVTS